MSEHQKNVVEEETPVMRSVAMHSMPQAVPIMPRMAPLRSAISKPVPHAKQQASKSAGAGSWNVTSLESIPPYYKLERTHVYIDETPEEVSKRIASSLRSESIAATFDDKQGRVTAETKEGVKFAIQLFSVNGRVVAEMQRTAGCGFLFHQTCKSVLRAAKTGVMKSPPSLPTAIPRCVPKATVEEFNSCTTESLEIARDMMKGGRMDAHLLACESLMQLTNASKCRAFCANFIVSSDMLETLLSLVQCSRMDRKALADECSLSEMEEEHFNMMHRHALTILANCLDALEATEELKSTLSATPDLVCESLLSTLVMEVACSAKKPHEAAQACKCLQKLCEQSECAKRRVAELGAYTHLENAQQCRHSMLQQASTELLGQL